MKLKDSIFGDKKRINRQILKKLIKEELKKFIVNKGTILKKEGIPLIINQDTEILMHPNNTKLIKLEDLVPGGKGDNTNSKNVDQDELKVGIAVEKEHTNSSDAAKEIAMDHLTEDPEYYSKLINSGLVDEPEAINLAKNVGMIEAVQIGKLRRTIKEEVRKVILKENNERFLKSAGHNVSKMLKGKKSDEQIKNFIQGTRLARRLSDEDIDKIVQYTKEYIGS